MNRQVYRETEMQTDMQTTGFNDCRELHPLTAFPLTESWNQHAVLLHCVIPKQTCFGWFSSPLVSLCLPLLRVCFHVTWFLLSSGLHQKNCSLMCSLILSVSLSLSLSLSLFEFLNLCPYSFMCVCVCLCAHACTLKAEIHIWDRTCSLSFCVWVNLLRRIIYRSMYCS
jgi:hypothetical protein